MYDSNLVYIHPLVNYRPSPDWYRAWERNLASGNSVWATVGSVSQQEFFTDVRLRVDTPLGDSPFRLLYSLGWLGGEHVDTETLQQFLGLEVRTWGPVGVHALIHPTPDKAAVDAAFGVILAEESRERFLRVSLRLDDLLYGDRNRDGGVSEGEPLGIQWEGRYAWPGWEVFSEGQYGGASERTFPDSGSSPAVAGTGGRNNGSQTRLRWLAAERSFLELELTHYDFVREESWREPAESFRYTNQVVNAAARFVFSFGGNRWRAWPGLQWLEQRASSEGRESDEFRRTDLMPQAFVEYSLSTADQLELGFMGSLSDRALNSADPARAFEREGWADKVKLGWTHHFSPHARIQFSLSHEVAPERFGGANVQFLGLF